MTPEQIEAHFTRADGRYVFARWARPLAPVVFGVTEDTLTVVKGAAEAVAQLAGIGMSEVDPELGINHMSFYFRNWSELTETPNLDKLVPDLAPLVARLEAANANQYRIFRFDADGAIRACFAFTRMDEDLSDMPADTLALSQMVQSILLWSDTAFRDTSPLARQGDGPLILRPDIANLIRAAYDPVLPDTAQDTAHALRLFARMGPVQ